MKCAPVVLSTACACERDTGAHHLRVIGRRSSESQRVSLDKSASTFWCGEYLRRSQLLNAQLRQPLAHVHCLVESPALEDTSAESAGEGITGTGGVVDLLLGDGVDGILLDLCLTLDGDNGGLGALGDDGDALAGGVLLGQISEGEGDVGDADASGEAVRLGVGGGLGLVADDVVPVGSAGIEGLLEELGDEGGGEGEDEGLVAAGGLLAEFHDGGRADYMKGGEKEKHVSLIR